VTPLKALIVDDEPVARRRLRRLLSQDDSIAIVGEAGDGQSAIEQTRALRPDVLLLDIQMPERSGLEVVTLLGRPRPHIVFVTAHDAHAVRAFELHALDYLLKPVTAARLAEAMARARAARASSAADGRLDVWAEWQDPSRPVTRLPVRSTGRIEIVPAAAIDWIESADNYAILHCGSRRHILRETMSRLEERLDPRAFQRIHRSTIVRRDRIARMEPVTRGDWRVTLADGTVLAMSRTYRRAMPRSRA
jgi:two-component system LytT family response regulator